MLARISADLERAKKELENVKAEHERFKKYKAKTAISK